MNKKATMGLAFVLLALSACGLAAGGNDTDNLNSPEINGNDEPFATEDQVSAPQVDVVPGPESIDIASSALYATDGYDTYQIDTSMQFTGVDPSGNTLTSSINSIVAQRTKPEEANRSVLYGGDIKAADTLEYVRIGNQIYSVYSGECSILSADNQQQEIDPSKQMFNLQEIFTGQAVRAETGIAIEGIITDRYELTQENLTPGPGVPTLISGNFYVASETGNIIKIEVNGTTRTDQYGMDPNQDTTITMTYLFNPSENIDIIPPEGCSDIVSDMDKYPIKEGATGLSNISGIINYQVNAQLKDVLDFYLTEMPAQGYMLTENTSSDTVAFATLRFTKDGTTIEVNAIQNGEQVSVDIKSE